MNKELYSIVSPCTSMFSNCNNELLYDNDNDDKKKMYHKKKINMIIGLFITFIAIYLAYDCNRGESLGMQIFYMIIAGLFSGLYLLYYLVVKVFLGKKCHKKVNMNFSTTSPLFNKRY
jgi:hypothetical protein